MEEIRQPPMLCNYSAGKEKCKEKKEISSIA
jgi:hypothetical protein